ncbi:MAG: efflux RND transporter periplasmic adaptor subunit [Rhodospirillaceae bacterium]|nr:efflux RND transporter periplasmic adaptor subunit [Rhodospirillaceae bacterium]
MKRKSKVAVAVLAVSLAITAIMLVTSRQLVPSEPEAVAPTVRVVDVAPASVRMVVHAQGTVSPRTEADLVPEVSGNVMWISPNLVSGGYFEAGEPLLRIDDRDYLSTLERARAAVNRTTAEDEFARFELERLQEMEARRLISPSDVETGMRAARVAAAALDDARAALEQAERDLSRTEVLAPFTGLVRAEQVDPGQFVSRGAPIARLYAVDYVEIRLPIADRQLAYLDLPPMQRGELDEATAPDVVLSAEFAGNQYQWHGKLARTEAEIDLRSRMVNAVARVNAADNAATDPDYVPPPVGLFVNAEIQGRSTEDIVVLPRSAIRDGNQVLVVDDDNRLRFRTVSIARIYADDAYIDGGLNRGERVCVSALQAVVDGMRVEVVTDDEIGMPGAPGPSPGATGP